MKQRINLLIFILFLMLNLSYGQNTGSIDKFVNSYCQCIEKMLDSKNLLDNIENDCLDELAPKVNILNRNEILKDKTLFSSVTD